jgi:hypothetical protein
MPSLNVVATFDQVFANVNIYIYISCRCKLIFYLGANWAHFLLKYG